MSVRSIGRGRENWNLSLFVSGKDHPNSQRAYANIVRICEEHLSGEYTLNVIDLSRTPEAAQNEQILALPTLVRRAPGPTRRIVDDLTDTDRVLVSLGVRTIDASPAV